MDTQDQGMTDADLAKLLAELALIAGEQGMISQAMALVRALAVLRPDSEKPFLIAALVQLNRRDFEGATRLLRDQALSIKPDSSLAHAFLGLVLHQQGRASERDRALNAALTAGDGDEDGIRLARNLLATPIGAA